MCHRHWEITIPPFLFSEESHQLRTNLAFCQANSAWLPKRIQTPPYVAVFVELLLSYSDCIRRLHRCQSKPNRLSTNNNSRKNTKSNKKFGEREARENPKAQTMSSLAAILALFVILSPFATSSTAAAGNDDSRSAYDIIQDFDLPMGLLPKGVTGYELDRSNGQFQAYLNGSCSFALEGSYQLKYKSTITGSISKNKLSGLTGVSVKVLFLWLNIVEVTRSGDNLEFSVGIASAAFPIDNFYECPQCGCGLDCVNGQVRKIKMNPLVSSIWKEIGFVWGCFYGFGVMVSVCLHFNFLKMLNFMVFNNSCSCVCYMFFYGKWIKILIVILRRNKWEIKLMCMFNWSMWQKKNRSYVA